MSKILDVKFESLFKISQLTDYLRKEAIRKALVLSLSQTIKTVIVATRKELSKQNQLKLDKKLYNKRVRRGDDRVDMSTTIPRLFARVVFSKLNESVSSFPYKLKPIRGKNGRRFLKVVATIQGQSVEPKDAFMVSPKKGKLIAGTLLSLKRNGKRTEYSKLRSDVSLSDILRKNTNLFDKLKSRANDVYEKKLSNNVNYYVNKAFKELKK